MNANRTDASDVFLDPTTDPSRLYDTRDRLYAADMLIAALRGIDFFSWLDAHPGTVDDIAAHFGFHRRPVDVMTTLFAAMGLVARDGRVLRTTALAREHLVAGSPWFMGPYYPRVSDRPIARDLLRILETGEPARFASRADEQDWHRAMETETFAEEFLAAMDCRGLVTGRALARHLDLAGRARLLDIAGGTGVFACVLAARFPSLRADVLEKAPVDGIAARAIARRGFSDRVGTVRADMLTEPLPHGYDVHLFSNVLHDWDEDVARSLVLASAAALAPGGTIVVHDTFLDADKCGPLDAAAYSVLLMHVTQGRCYSLAEVGDWLQSAGFSAPAHVPGAIGRSALVATKV